MVLLLTPLPIEHEAALSALGGPERLITYGRVSAALTANGVACAIGGHGKVQFALTAQHLIRELQPRLVICAGACGALDSHLRRLDVVAATETIEHDYRLRFIQRPEPRFPGSAQALERLKAARVSFPLHFGRIASGDEDIIAAERAAELRAQTSALAVAWEGAGGARACAFAQVPYLELRTVTDTANEHAARDFKAHVKAGMERIAQAVRVLLSAETETAP